MLDLGLGTCFLKPTNFYFYFKWKDIRKNIKTKKKNKQFFLKEEEKKKPTKENKTILN
jgi:hypothetical protein